jgi:energy-coupling factor transporter ATP-binding protein EcfA2
VQPELADVVGVFRQRLYLPDPSPLLTVLGTIAANRLDGDPVWLMLVGPPGSGKSELLQATGGLPDVHPTATLTEAALLSGTPKRETDDRSTGGLLRLIDKFGIIICKDFGSVLSMHRDARAQVLAALREVYDGSWTRHVGTDGGKTLSWTGRVGLIAGVTPTVDRHHGVMASMGERFAFLRMPEVDASEQARRALAHAGHEHEMRTELSTVVRRFFDRPQTVPGPLEPKWTDKLISLSTLVVRCRSSVERDGYTREIELVPESEAPTRLVIVLARLFAGLESIGIPNEQAWPVVVQVGLDSIPALRRRVMEVLVDGEETVTSKVAERTDYPLRTTERSLEDLTAHGIAARHANGQGKATSWTMTDWARERYLAALTTSPETSQSMNGRTSPETSGALFNHLHTFQDDKSGEVALAEADAL